MQKWEGIKEYKMVGGEILGTKFPVLFFFCCGSVIGDTFLSFSIKVPLTMTRRNNFLSNTSERDAVSLLGYSAVGYLFVPTVGRSFYVVDCHSVCQLGSPNFLFLARPHWSWKCSLGDKVPVPLPPEVSIGRGSYT